MRHSGLRFLEAVTGVGLGVVAAVTLQFALRPPLHAQTIAPRPDHACRLPDRTKPPYLHGEVVPLGGMAYLCDGYSGSWRRLPDGAVRRARTGDSKPPIL